MMRAVWSGVRPDARSRHDAPARTLMSTPSAIFSPIEYVIREAEARAVREWEREHQPCPHDGETVQTFSDRHPRCADCGAEVPD